MIARTSLSKSVDNCETAKRVFLWRDGVAEDIWGHLDPWGVRGLHRVVSTRCGGIWSLTAAIKGNQRGRGSMGWAGSIPADLCRITR